MNVKPKHQRELQTQKTVVDLDSDFEIMKFLNTQGFQLWYPMVLKQLGKFQIIIN